MFLTDVGKEGSTLRGMMNAFATLLSIALQYGVPLESLVAKFAFVRFEPEGITGNREIPFAKSMPDYILRWLASRFLDGSHHAELGIRAPAATPRGPVGPRPGDAAADELAEGVKRARPAATAGVGASEAGRAVPSHADGRICRDCGAAMRRTGACETCPSCGQNTGCG